MKRQQLRGLSFKDHTKIAAAIHRIRRELSSIEALVNDRCGRSHVLAKALAKAFKSVNVPVRSDLENSLFSLPEIARLSTGDRHKFLFVYWPAGRVGDHEPIDGEAWLASQPDPSPWWETPL